MTDIQLNTIYNEDCLETMKRMPDGFVDCVITSPPYWGLRDYGVDGQLGLEKTPEEYVDNLVNVFREVKRILKKEGTVWLNLGDSYAVSQQGGDKSKPGDKSYSNHGTLGMDKVRRIPIGLKQKDLVGIPWRVAFALQADGWYLRQDIIWSKPNPMPESVTDRCTKSHEYVFLLTKSPKYYFDNTAIKEDSTWGGDPRAGYGRLNYRGKRQGQKGTGQEAFVSITQTRNKRSVWSVNVMPFKGAHFATFPKKLITPMVKAGCPERGIVLDPFFGSGTTGYVAKKLARNYIGIELNPEYIDIANKRLAQEVLL